MLAGERVDADRLVYFDTETTGLSGGAGTTVFLVGTGHHVDDELEVVQTLLLDFPGEPAFLRVVAEQMSRGDVWVSYNGRAFDQRLLETRFLMCGLQPLHAQHLDLLYWARRMWRSLLPACALGDLERDVLNVRREIDIPGFQIPERYFSFLKTGKMEVLAEVVEHHLQDIVTLARLLGLLARMVNAPLEPWNVDRFQLGRYLLLAGDRRGIDVLRAAVESGTATQREKAGLFLARLLRRRGDPGAACEIWKRLWSAGSLVAGVELAKHYEHRVRDRRTALGLVDCMLERADGRLREELTRRRERLLRLVDGSEDPGVEPEVL